MMLACMLGAPSVARGQTAEEIVAANIKASGGEQAIARIDTFTSKGRITVESQFFGTLEGTLEAVRVPGRGYYEHVLLARSSRPRAGTAPADGSWSVNMAVDAKIFAAR